MKIMKLQKKNRQKKFDLKNIQFKKEIKKKKNVKKMKNK